MRHSKLKNLFLLVAIFLSSCGGGGESPSPPVIVPANIMEARSWEIGPIIDGQNLSVGMPLNPAIHPEGWSIDIPYSTAGAGHVHYITVPTNSLSGKTKVTLTARLEMKDGVRLAPVKSPDSPSLLTLYFQRKGDNWSAQGEYEAYRWYASFATRVDLKSGDYVMEANFDQNWTAILTSSRTTNPTGFQNAINDAGRIGFVLGGHDGLGHGVFATGPARLVVKSFKIE